MPIDRFFEPRCLLLTDHAATRSPPAMNRAAQTHITGLSLARAVHDFGGVAIKPLVKLSS